MWGVGCGQCTMTALNLLRWNWSGGRGGSFYPNIVAKPILLFSSSIVVNHDDVCQTLLVLCSQHTLVPSLGSWLDCDCDEGKLNNELGQSDTTQTADNLPLCTRYWEHQLTAATYCSNYQLNYQTISFIALPPLRPARPSSTHFLVSKTQTGIC